MDRKELVKMIKMREYYSDVYKKEDDERMAECRSCNRTFLIGNTLLDIPEEEEYNEDEIIERCPYCESDFIF